MNLTSYDLTVDMLDVHAVSSKKKFKQQEPSWKSLFMSVYLWSQNINLLQNVEK